MIGCHYKNYSDIFNIQIDKKSNYIHIEDIWFNRISKYNNILKCKQFDIEPTQRGGINIKWDNI